LLLSLPPKKINAGEIFLEKRLNGLTRYINYISRHPVLKEDSYVLIFLKESIEISTYRKSRKLSICEETGIRALTVEEKACLPEDLEIRLKAVRDTLKPLFERYQTLCKLLERFYNRAEANGKDIMHYNAILQEFANPKSKTYDMHCPSYDSLTSGFKTFGEGLEKIGVTWIERSKIAGDRLLECLRFHRDVIASFEALLQRYDKLMIQGYQALDAIKSRKESNTAKLQTLSHNPLNPDLAVKETEKLVELIRQDSASINDQENRIQFSRFIIMSELQFYHAQFSLLSRGYQDYATDERIFQTKLETLWRHLETVSFQHPSNFSSGQL